MSLILVSEPISTLNALMRSQASVEFDLSGTILGANDRFLTLMGYKLAEVVGKHHSIFVTPDAVCAPEYTEFWRKLRTGSFQSAEFKRVTKSGSYVYLQASYNPVLDEHGRPCRILKIAQDVTERKLRDANYEGQLQAIAHSQAMVEFNIDGYVLHANERFLSAMGYDISEVVGRHHSMFVDKIESAGEEYREFWQALRSGRYQAADFRRVHKLGHDVWIQATYNPVMDLSGRPIKVVKLASYITSDVPHGDAFQVLARISDAVVVLDRQWRYTYMNTQAVRIFGHEGVSLVGKNIWDVQPSLTGSPLYAACHRALKEHIQVEVEDYYPLYARWIECRICPVRSGLTILFSDVSQRRAATQMLRLREKALHSSSDGIVITDALSSDMPVIYVNRAFTKLTGYDANEVVGKNCRFMQGDRHEESARTLIRAAIATRTPGVAVLRNFRKDGSMFFNELRIAPVHDDSGVVTHFIGSQTDVSDRIRYEQELEHQANHDTLTDLPNRKRLEKLLEKCIENAKIGSYAIGVAFLDIDNFKDINDTLGHSAGDTLLREIAQRLRVSVRPGDIVARLGGDEFVIVCPGLKKLDDINAIASTIYASLRTPVSVADCPVTVDVSIGLSGYPEHASSVSDLLKCADMAMYSAKSSGQGALCIYEPSMGVVVAERTQIERDLRNAIANEELVLHYQPKFGAKSGKVCGMEALLRWNHPTLGLIGPASFIEIAECTKLIVPIGEWVLRKACVQNRAWMDSGFSSIPMSINVSVRQLNQLDFYETVERALLESNLPGCLLDLEITETVAMNRPDLIIPMLKRIKELGVKFSIDDFGTGYSSLSYIKNLPIDCLKIDRSFVRDMLVDSGSAAICRTIISMAHHLNLHVIAEGVETQEQADYLRLHECDELQGFLLCMPENVRSIGDRLAGRRPMHDNFWLSKG